MMRGAIHCEGCEATIERFVSRLPGVQAVKASEETQIVSVTWDPEAIGVDQVQEKLDELGYRVER
ncbi:MAG: heavy-metal-associated domain-containing protein [Chloroflexi bacterium]|nr:heavy-metal-associated domain-containing protein [Chloroflexota bacterium]